MTVATINHETLSTQLGQEVSEVMVVVAKHRAAGVGLESLADMIGCAIGDLEELELNPVYTEVRGIIGALTASLNADQGLLWDSIEQKAATKLLARVDVERDTDTLLRIAATANRMTRRVGAAKGGPLDPGLQGGKVSIQLTRRMVERLTGEGAAVRASEESVSIHGGSMSNPSFDEVSELLSLKPARITAPPEAEILRDLGFLDSE
jgi:hypothetical protein